MSNTNTQNRSNLKRAAHDIVKDAEKVSMFFDADSFFNTTYMTGLLHGRYFVIKNRCEHSNGTHSDFYKVKEIRETGIKSLAVTHEFRNADEAKKFVRHYHGILKSILTHADKTIDELRANVEKGEQAFKLTNNKDMEVLALKYASLRAIEIAKTLSGE